STPGPITAPGPISTPSPRRAVGSTTALGWIVALTAGSSSVVPPIVPPLGPSPVHHGRADHGLGRQLPVDQRTGGELAVEAPQAKHLDLVAHLVARNHRPAELHLVDRGQVDDLAPPLRQVVEEEDAA